MDKPSALDRYLEMMKKVREIVSDKEIPEKMDPALPAKILMDNFELTKLRKRMARESKNKNGSTNK